MKKAVYLLMLLFLMSLVVSFTDKTEYKLGETVIISINDTNAEVSILSLNSNSMYQFLGDITKEIRFTPKEAGEYLINVVGDEIQAARFAVIDEQINKIFLERHDYKFGDTVVIRLNNAKGYFIELRSPKSSYFFLGETNSDITFEPNEFGEFKIYLKDEYGKIWETESFFVGYEQKIKINKLSKIRIKDSKNRELFTKIQIYKNSLPLKKVTSDDVLDIEFGEYDLDMNFTNTYVHNFKIFNLTYAGDFELDYEDLSNDSVRILGMTTKKVFAIDPTKINFDHAEVKSIAIGHELYKCKAYNFTVQRCFGTYEKIMNLTPGEEYTFILTPEDPQYTEQTSSTAGCSCTNSCTTASGTSSTCPASCTDYCDINFNTPPGAISGWLEKVHYSVTITIGGTGTPVSASHAGRLDKDTTPVNGNDVSIGSSTTTTTLSTIFPNNNMPDRSAADSFDDISCATWSSGYCTWKPYLSSTYTCRGSRKTCITTISLTLINYTWNYTPDTTAPTITGLNPPTNTYKNTASNTFYYTPNDNLALRNCSIFLNSVRNQTNTTVQKNVATTFTVTNMADNTYSWYIQCFDTSNNQVSSTARNLIVDKTAPTLAYITPTPVDNYFSQTNAIIINFSHTETNPDKRILNWSGTLYKQSYSGSFTNITRTGLADQQYRYYVYLNDSATNSIRLSDRIVTIDTVDPLVSLNNPGNGNWINYNSIVFNFTPTDSNLKNCSLYINNSGSFSYKQVKTTLSSGVKNSFAPESVSDGVYKWNVLCFDKSLRSKWASINYTVKIDSVKPVVNLLDPKNNTKENESNIVLFNYTVTDSNQILNCSFEARSNTTTIAQNDNTITKGERQNFSVTLPNSRYNWTIRCKDVAGNVNSPLPGKYNLTVYVTEDYVGPQITLNNPQNNNWTNLNDINFIYTPSDRSNLLNCSLFINNQLNQTNRTIFEGTKNNFTINNFNDGSYSWHINCTDNSTYHNVGKSQTYTFAVDTGKPGLQQIFPQNNYNRTVPQINFTWYIFDELSSNNYCDLVVNNTIKADDVLTLNNTYANFTASFTSDGKYFWNITCRDEAYNFNTSKTRYFTLDTHAPNVTAIKPENSNVSTRIPVFFTYRPSENLTGLYSCSLYINGIYNKSANANNNILNNVSQNFRSGDYTWQVKCLDGLFNQGATLSRAIRIDVDQPKTIAYSVYPSLADLGQTVKINATVTDNYGVSKVIAQIRKPSGTTTNYTMTLKVGSIYNLTYIDTTERGTYTVNFFSNDTYSNKNKSQSYYFFVKPGISIDKIYYGLGERITITGSGYDANDNITINITNPINVVIYSKNFIASPTGTFTYVYNISTNPGQLTNNYTINAFDTFQSTQSGLAYPWWVRKPATANIFDKSRTGTIVTSSVNESENTRATIEPKNGEDYVNISWHNIVPDGQVISDIRFTEEHSETANYNQLIYWFNRTSSTWSNICTINANLTSDEFDTCQLNSWVRTSAEANNLRLKISDGNALGPAVGLWTNIDFVYIKVRFTNLRTDKTTYQQGENVTIYGSNWPSSSSITINVTRANGITDKITTTSNVNGEFTKIYQVPYNGAIGQYNLTVYLTSNPVDSDTYSFDVIKRNSTLQSNKKYYGREEKIFLTGKGYSLSGNVSILIYDAKNILMHNQTIKASPNFNGTISYNWTIPYNYQGYYGMHTIIAQDRLYHNLNSTINVTIGVIADKAQKIQNAQSYNDLAKINRSDNFYSYLAVYNADEDQIRMQFLNSSLQNRVLTNLTFYIEHRELQAFDLVLEWYNGTNWIDLCRFNDRAVEGFDSCSILSQVERTIRMRNLTLKITDNQTDFGVPGQNWTMIDYVYLVSWTEPDTAKPSLKILDLPKTYNYSQGIMIKANVSDNVLLDKVWANISWAAGSQLIYLSGNNINYYGDGSYNKSFTQTNTLGRYNVTIFANDTSGNKNTTTSYFLIRSPDLTYLNFNFSNYEPMENQNISINLTIKNIGNANSSQFTVGFYDNGIMFDSFVIAALNTSKNLTIKTSWKAKIGYHSINARIDIPLITNGAIWEINESNNNITKLIFVPAWQVFFGNSTGNIKLENLDNKSKFEWNASTGNIYVAETGTDISWANLIALGRDINDIPMFNDFNESDSALNLSAYPDSINRTFTYNNAPLLTKDFTVYKNLVANVPVVNSTNSSNFQTGIMWDSSDIAITYYNGTQDLIFITEMNYAKTGRYGTYDYEIRFPSTLDNYKLGSGTVTFYTEIT